MQIITNNFQKNQFFSPTVVGGGGGGGVWRILGKEYIIHHGF